MFWSQGEDCIHRFSRTLHPFLKKCNPYPGRHPGEFWSSKGQGRYAEGKCESGENEMGRIDFEAAKKAGSWVRKLLGYLDQFLVRKRTSMATVRMIN
jgi:hypothetical protein